MTDIFTDIFSVADKVVCITGSSRGLGKAIAKGFAERGAKVVICAWNLAELEATKSEFQSQGLEVYAVEVDVSSRDNCKQLIDRTVEHYDAIDVLICNAGIDIIKPAEQYEAEEWDKILDINLRGYYFCAQFAAQRMLDRSGSIIMTSSIAGAVGIPGLVPMLLPKVELIKWCGRWLWNGRKEK